MTTTTKKSLAFVDALRRSWPHQRLCLIYKEKAEQIAAASQFLEIGLATKDQCLLLASPDDAQATLAAIGASASRPGAAAAVRVFSDRRVFCRAGRFQQDLFFERVAEWRREAGKSPHEEMRLACDMAWLLGARAGEKRILEFEAKMEQFAREQRVLGLFGWDRREFSPEAVRSALNTYPLLVYEGAVARNFNYLSPEELLGPNRGAGELDRLLSHVVSREQIERQIHEERESLLALVEGIPETFCLITLTGRVVQCNEEAARRLGATQEELLGSCLFDFFPKDMAHFRQRLEAVVRTGHRERFVDQRSGRTFDNGVYPVFDALGSVTRLAILGLDITERLCAEETLRSTLRRLESFRSMVNQSPAIVILARIAADWPIDFISDNIAQLGYAAEDVIAGRVRWLDIAHPDDGPRMYAQIEKNLRLGRELHPQDFRLRDAAGEYRWMRGHVRLIVDEAGNWTHVQAVMIDISASKRMEDELRQTLERLKVMESIVNQSPAIVVRARLAKGWPVEYVSESMRQWGYSPSEVLAGSVTWMENSFPEEGRRVVDDVKANFRAGRDAFRSEYRVRTAAGEMRWTEAYEKILRDESGAPTHLQAVVLDVTDRKCAEEALRAHQDRLQSIFRAAPVGIGIIDRQTIKEVNDRVCEMSGYTREELVGQSLGMIYATPEEFLRAAIEAETQLRERCLATFECRCRAKDGTLSDILVNLAPLNPGDPAGDLTFTTLDITDRKRAEKALREALKT